MVSLLHIFKPFRQIIPDVPAPASRVPFKYVIFGRKIHRIDPSGCLAVLPRRGRDGDRVFLDCLMLLPPCPRERLGEWTPRR